MQLSHQLLLSSALLLAAVCVSAHNYKPGDDIQLYANKVGPFSNPTETYRYFSLGFCQPEDGARDKLEDLGEVLEGDRLVSTPYTIKFRTDIDNKILCQKKLSQSELKRLRQAVREDYYFQMYYDDLPVWGFLGKLEKLVKTGVRKEYLFTHFHFEISFNGDKVIEINVSSDPVRTIDISDGDSMDVEFSYSVKWKDTTITYDHRMDRYSRYSFLPQHLEIHWFSIINSCVTVLLLTGFLATILLRVLKNDFLKYTKDDESHPGDDAEETGWKYLHGDVFRFPPHVNLMSAMIGVGTQMLVVALCVFGLALVGVFYPYNRGGLLSSCVVIYALTATIAGYIGGVYYKMFGGTNWVSNVALCAVLFCGPVLLIFSYLNTVAIFYRDHQAASTTKLPHEVPPPTVIYTIYSILFIVFIILIIVTAFITVALTYFQLAVEDHRWWWRSFVCGGSTGLFVFGYCFYYYFVRSDMTGLMQTSFFFGYNGLVCYAFFLMLGSVGFRASLIFIRHIYRAIKCE
eukprot:gene21840-28870_t